MATNFIGRTDLPRGLRNNNPGNITTGDSWLGSIGADPPFIIFSDVNWGIRAIAKSLRNMIGKGIDTIATLIPHWSATDQQAYISNVAERTGIDPDTQLGTDDDTISSLIRAIIIQENGEDFSPLISDQDIIDGMALANGGVSTVAQAAVVQAQNNPMGTGLVILAAIALLAYIFEE